MHAFRRKIEKTYRKKKKIKKSIAIHLIYGYENLNSNKLLQIKCNSMSF